jgi:Glycosyl transferase family 90
MANQTKCVDREQFNDMLLRKDVTYREVDMCNNIFKEELKNLTDIFKDIRDRFSDVDSRTVWNTYDYIAGKFKKGGIFISIRESKLKRFVSFRDGRYRNDFWHLLKCKPEYGSIQNLINCASERIGKKNKQIALPLNEWSANDGLLRYDDSTAGIGFAIYKDMFTTLCSEEYIVPDVECFLNKRDFPILKKNGTEPYDNLYGSTNVPLRSHKYEKHAPILSACKSKDFADILIPSYEDWCRARYQRDKIVLNDREYPKIVDEIEWASKTDKAVFRGSSTGLGVTPATNQRLLALEMAETSDSYLDVGITKWNLRIRKHMNNQHVEIIERKSYPLKDRMTLQQQTDKFKYILNLEGHTAAFRLGYELSSKSVVLLADSKWKLWYSDFLEPYTHYVPVKNDLSDLYDMIRWCRDNDERCVQIIKNANAFYEKYLGVDGILDYLQLIFSKISESVDGYEWFENFSSIILDAEKAMIPEAVKYDYENAYLYDSDIYLPRCIGKLEANKSAFQRSGELGPGKIIYYDEHTTIRNYKTNGINLVKKYSTEEKEHVHELYIGLNAVNKLVSTCMNFVYTYGYHHSDDKGFFREYIKGKSLYMWLISNEYNEMDLLDIMILINLAITSAQSQCAFIHYDLNPSNIILNVLRNPMLADYNVGLSPPLRYTTKIIPMIIDYGKSRAVVYEKGNGLVDRGIVNLYKNKSQSLDMLTLLYTVLKTLKTVDRNNKRLIDFLRQHKLSTDVDRMSVYGAVIDYTNNYTNTNELTSLTFVDHFGKITKKLETILPNIERPFRHIMCRGSSYIEEMKMKLGFTDDSQKDEVIRLAVMRLDRKTFPRSENKLIRRMIELSLKRHMIDMDAHVEKCRNQDVKDKYELVRSLIMDFDYKTVSSEIDLDQFPSWNLPILNLDIRMTPEELIELKLVCEDFRENNWLDIISMCVESQIDDPALKLFEYHNLFEYINAIASHNTCMWLYLELFTDDI